MLIIKDRNINFDITKLQIDNTLNIKIEIFIDKEETEIIKAKFKAKSQIILKTRISETFNSYYMIIKDKTIIIIQKNQGNKLLIVNIEDDIKKQWYIEYRPCGAYITSIY